jgi:hypothetical protein
MPVDRWQRAGIRQPALPPNFTHAAYLPGLAMAERSSSVLP